jgi:hypothetical protein
MYGLKNLTAKQLYDRIAEGTRPEDIFSVSIRLVAERVAVNALIEHGRAALVYFGSNEVQLKRL